MQAYFKKMQAYNHWANQLVLNGLMHQELAPETSRGLLSHIFLAEKAWLTRLEGSNPTFSIFQILDWSDLSDLMNQNDQGWKHLLARESDFEKDIAYQTFAGEPFTSRLSDILAHIFNHGTYHRAQIASQMRQAGLEPVATDYIRFSRLN